MNGPIGTSRVSRKQLGRVAAALIAAGVCIMIVGCGPSRFHRPVPAELAETAFVPGFETVRTWGDVTSEQYKQSFVDAARQAWEYYEAHPDETMPETVDILALSGGGENGAFGAGLLCGWTERGDRPEFQIISGISTGALIAPLAFAGPDFDDTLRDSYTEVTQKNIFTRKPLLSLLTDDALSGTEPLKRMLEESVNEALIERIAAEHAKGRRLLIATTNLEEQRPVIWDMGAIASSGHPRTLQAFRAIMRASASIPGAFPPVYIDVEASDGKIYEEMHVDGGAISQAFLWGAGLSVNEIVEELGLDAPRRPIRLFVVRNGRFEPERKELRSLFLDIAGRAVSTLIKNQGVGDMYRLYVRAQTNGMDFNLAWIPPSFERTPTEPFEQDYMRELFQLSYDMALEGYPWVKHPPYMVVDE